MPKVDREVLVGVAWWEAGMFGGISFKQLEF
jgi:hypothetical protein